MQTEPGKKEHAWLRQLVGEWTYEGESDMGTGQMSKSSGTESIRAIGDLWIIAEGHGTMPGGEPAITLGTLGYDPQRKQFTGTWIGSMMSYLWSYDRGSLDPTEKILTLECDGPSFSEEARAAGKTARYRDVFEIRSDNHRVLTASVRNDDGTWTTFMTTHYRRK